MELHSRGSCYAARRRLQQYGRSYQPKHNPSCKVHERRKGNCQLDAPGPTTGVHNLTFLGGKFSPFSPLETISTYLWASLYHHLPVLSVFSHVSCQFVFAHTFSVVVDPSVSRPPRSSLPRYDHVHIFS